MLQTDSRFHAVVNDCEKGSFLFVRLRHPVLEILNSDKAYQASISHPVASIAGSTKPPAKQLISLVLSIPKTTARISSDELQLRCTDSSSVQLLVKLPITPIPAKAVLQELHAGLMLAAASLEGALLETVGADTRTEIAEITPQSLDVLHGPLIAGGQPVELRSAFRRVAAADTRLHAARAFSVAHTAGRVREEILGRRKERQDQERRKRRRERERVREAKKLMSAGRSAKRPKPSLFDIESQSPNGERAPNTIVETEVKVKDVQNVVPPAISTPSVPRKEACQPNAMETAVRTETTGNSTHDAKSRDGQQAGVQSAQREADEPSQRRKKRKKRKLV